MFHLSLDKDQIGCKANYGCDTHHKRFLSEIFTISLHC